MNRVSLYLVSAPGQKMPDKKITIRRGERLSVELPVESEPSTATPENARRAVLFPPDEDEDLYVFRKEGITFYDLGTRKNEDGSYRDIIPGSFLLGSVDFWTYYHSTLLQGDFIKECLKVKQKAQFVYFDASFLPSNLDLDTQRNLVGERESRPLIQNLPGGESSHETKWKNASLPFKPPADLGDWFLSIESAFYYNAFFTGDPNEPGTPYYKITSSPDPASAAIAFALKGNEKVYLTPIWTMRSTGATIYHTRRLPVLPNFEPQAQPLTILDYTLGELRARASAELWAAVDAYYTAHYAVTPFWSAELPHGTLTTEFTIDSMLATIGTVVDGLGHVTARNGIFGYDLIAHPRALVAVIVQGKDKFYVWQNSVISESDGTDVMPGAPRVFWKRTRIYHP